MTDTKHTPGRWRVGGIGTNPKYSNLIVYDFRGLEVARCHPHPGEHFESCRRANAEANAHLIAAAPMMLEALEQFADHRNWFDTSGEAGGPHPAWRGEGAPEDIAEAAIKAARGETWAKRWRGC